MNKHTWIIGFYAICYVFGAGNLIFPPNLGQSGAYFWPAILAFV